MVNKKKNIIQNCPSHPPEDSKIKIQKCDNLQYGITPPPRKRPNETPPKSVVAKFEITGVTHADDEFKMPQH